MAAGKRTQRCISLALQGGGSFGAFTWGVLDRFLEEPGLALDMVSGASAGAINAVVLADGLAAGGRDAARRKLARVWRRVSDASPLRGPAVAMAASALELSSHLVSPRQMNPLGLDPLRDILEDEVDFARLRAFSPIRLLIAATRVRDGRARLFGEDEITLSALLASACLPAIHPAVEVDGEAYWDGGFSANPPLRDLVCDTTAKGDRAGNAASRRLVRIAVASVRDLPARARDRLQRLTAARRGVARSTPARLRRAAPVPLCPVPQARAYPHLSAFGRGYAGPQSRKPA